MSEPHNKIGLRRWLWRAYVQSALLPLVLVETVLIACYLLSNQAIRDAQVQYLEQNAMDSLSATADQNAQIIQDHLGHIAANTDLFAHMVEQALANPAHTLPERFATTADGARYSPRNLGGAASFYSAATPLEKHDLGKIGIADSILLKEGPLTLEERTAMMEHPRIGYSILHEEGGTELIDMAAEIAYCHHEKWDGSGYPRGLAGDAIPLAARIVALCDVYDALRMDRPYKRAWSPERAQAHILEQSGRHFDPQLVEALQTRFADIEALLEDRDEALYAHIV
ncbi:response regulator RpfG family c-di-GMP phosphodiesterase [Pseudomonas alcaligenes]|nr:response regulator RpfG family c-di-GMP phosphodiesterase [Pseudomonas alcaligenes]